MGENRADPDELLRAIQNERNDQRRGHLKIFFGYAAGVGKTYAMLQAAQAAKRRGVDVVVGYVEPHARPQTAELQNGLEAIPAKLMRHEAVELREFDLDAALARGPQLILVDELAHTNAVGCRHAKRYQDVEELLSAGIDVYTTVNVQHIESLNDMVASITGILVRERIPDRVFDRADQVELMDIEPQDLIERLNAGRIYKETQAQRALANFFSVENLIALREIALRRCADRVNQLSENARIKSNSDYYTDEHILVCLSSSPTNAKIIRTAARMAQAFRGTFTALFVETPDFLSMDDENRNRLRANLHLAEQLGAAIETVYGDDVAFQISEFARMSGVSKIVLGRSSAKRKHIFSRASLTERLIAYAPNLDVYVIPDRNTPTFREKRLRRAKQKFVPADLLKSALVLVAATVIGFLFFDFGFSESNIVTIYILGVLVTAVITTQRGYSLVSSVVSVIVFNFFFTDPRYSLNAYDPGYPVTFAIMFVSAFLTSTLAVRIQQHARQSAQTAYRTRVLLDTNQLLQHAKEKQSIIAVAAGQLTKLLEHSVVFYTAENGTLSKPNVFLAATDGGGGDALTENERAVATWVLQNNKHAGATTKTLSNAKCLYLAVRINQTVYGVVGIVLEGAQLEAFEHSIVLSILGECALAMENEQAAREKAEAAVLAKNEQLRANLLRSISHDLRTPLTSISGNASILLAGDEAMMPEKRKQLYGDIYDDSLWLINLVENLLAVTRIEDGTLSLKMTAELLDEIITEALRHVNRRHVNDVITVRQDDELLLVKVDARLIVQVVVNIVDNAVKYTPEGSAITISTHQEGGMAVVEIADDGPGIPDEAKPRNFDMFYTAATNIVDSRRSLGLGLALCKSIVNVHGGDITVTDHKPTGTVFRFTLPAEEVTLHE